MKISYINLTSLICCYLPVFIITHSTKTFIILVNGILFHTHIDNKPLLIYDLIVNCGFTIDTYYYNPHLRNQITLGCFITFINFYIMYGNNYKYRFERNKHDIIHAIITHGYGSYLLYLSLLKTSLKI